MELPSFSESTTTPSCRRQPAIGIEDETARLAVGGHRDVIVEAVICIELRRIAGAVIGQQASL
jgi:hypothetical protein